MSYIGKTPTPAPLTSSDITDSIISLPKLTDGTDGNLISYDASGNPVAVATGSDGQVLTSTGAGSPPAFETLAAGGITVADQFKLTSAFGGNAAPIASNLSRINRNGQGTLGTGMSESSGIFTFPSTGIYHVGFTANTQLSGDNRFTFVTIHATTDNSTYAVVSESLSHITQNQSSHTYSSASVDTLIDVTNTSNVKVRFHIAHQNTSTTTRGESTNCTYMTFIRLGDT